MYVVADLTLERVATVRHQLVGSPCTEIAAAAQCVLRHRRAQAGVDIAHEHRRGGKVVEHPATETRLAAGIAVVDEQTDREGMRHEAAAHESAVGSIREHRLHLFAGRLVGFPVLLRGTAQAVAECLLVHHLSRLHSRGIAAEQSLDGRIGICQGRDDTFLLSARLCLPVLIVVDGLDATVQRLPLRQVAGEGTG